MSIGESVESTLKAWKYTVLIQLDDWILVDKPITRMHYFVKHVTCIDDLTVSNCSLMSWEQGCHRAHKLYTSCPVCERIIPDHIFDQFLKFMEIIAR